MKNKLGQGLAVGLTTLISGIVACVGMVVLKQPEVLLVMALPIIVTFFITVGDGWE